MTDTLLILGQIVPSAATLTTLYTVPAATSTTVSSIVVSNSSATPTSFRISLAVAGAADNAKQYIYYDIPIGGNDTFIATVGLTLATTDLIRVYSTLATCAFSAFGVQIT